MLRERPHRPRASLTQRPCRPRAPLAQRPGHPLIRGWHRPSILVAPKALRWVPSTLAAASDTPSVRPESCYAKAGSPSRSLGRSGCQALAQGSALSASPHLSSTPGSAWPPPGKDRRRQPPLPGRLAGAKVLSSRSFPSGVKVTVAELHLAQVATESRCLLWGAHAWRWEHGRGGGRGG